MYFIKIWGIPMELAVGCDRIMSSAAILMMLAMLCDVIDSINEGVNVSMSSTRV